jgi:hypothetical protein
VVGSVVIRGVSDVVYTYARRKTRTGKQPFPRTEARTDRRPLRVILALLLSDQAHRALPHLGRMPDVLPMTPSSSTTGASIKPGTVQDEARSNTSVATASRRNPIARPNWGE